MALILHHSFSLLTFALFFFLPLKSCSCFNPKLLNVSSEPEPLGSFRFLPAVATWYGDPNGAGTNGGACGYGSAVEVPPFSKMVSAGGAFFFAKGFGCGACYQVKCTTHAACSGRPVKVVIADECPGCDPVHFDMSGTAFGAMARKNQHDQLRSAGILKVQYRRVPCRYRGVFITFRVDPGSNPYFLAFVVEYENDDGELAAVALKQPHGPWLPMRRMWGAVWELNSGAPLRGPFSVKLTEPIHRKTVVAKNVIPVGWRPGGVYRSLVNF